MAEGAERDIRRYACCTDNLKAEKVLSIINIILDIVYLILIIIYVIIPTGKFLGWDFVVSTLKFKVFQTFNLRLRLWFKNFQTFPISVLYQQMVVNSNTWNCLYNSNYLFCYRYRYSNSDCHILLGQRLSVTFWIHQTKQRSLGRRGNHGRNDSSWLAWHRYLFHQDVLRKLL